MTPKTMTPKTSTLKATIVIPARLASTRLTKKLLRQVAGKSILQYTHEAAMRCQRASGVIVAVDDAELFDEVKRFGGRAVMTSPACRSGTDRIAEVAQSETENEIFVNVQGDEPEINPDSIDQVIELLQQHEQASASTLATPITSAESLLDPNCVKVVFNQASQAMYFSRSPIPFQRSGNISELLAHKPPLCWQHVGLYAYRRDVLEWFANQPESPLETSERLEQLRLLDAGRQILVGRTQRHSIGIDTLADLQAFEQVVAAQQRR